MTTRALATFLHRLLTGKLDPDGPVGSSTTLAQLMERPAPALQALLVSHIDTLLASWPDGSNLRPTAISSATLWAAAALNNLAWSVTHPDPQLQIRSLRLVQALSPATDLASIIAYHSVLRHINQLDPDPAWQPVAHELIARSPLTALWLPRIDGPLSQETLVDLLTQRPLRSILRDRWLSLTPNADEVRRGISTSCATANATVGTLLGQLLTCGEHWRPVVLSFYEADCALQQQGNRNHPTWPMIEQLRMARISIDPRQRRNAERLLTRYRPLAALLAEEAALRPYLQLDVRFLVQIGTLCRA